LRVPESPQFGVFLPQGQPLGKPLFKFGHGAPRAQGIGTDFIDHGLVLHGTGENGGAGQPTPLLLLPFFDPAYGGRTSILVQPLVYYSNKVPPARFPEHTWARERKLPRPLRSLTQAQRAHLPTVCAPQIAH